MLSIPVASALICSLLGTVVSQGVHPATSDPGSGSSNGLSTSFTVDGGSPESNPKTLQEFKSSNPSSFRLELTANANGADFNGTFLLPAVLTVYDWIAYHLPADGKLAEISVPGKHGIGINITQTSNFPTSGANGTRSFTNLLALMAIEAATQIEKSGQYVESTGIGYSDNKEFGRISIYLAADPVRPGETKTPGVWSKPSAGDGGTNMWKRSSGHGAALERRGVGPWHYDGTLNVIITTEYVPIPALTYALQWTLAAIAWGELNQVVEDFDHFETFDKIRAMVLPNAHVELGRMGPSFLSRQVLEALYFVSEFQLNQRVPIAANITFLFSKTPAFYIEVGQGTLGVAQY